MLASTEVKAKVVELGFDVVGIADARDPALGEAITRYASWLDAGYGASMDYLRRHLEVKANPDKLLPGFESVVCVGLLYGTVPPIKDGRRAQVSMYTRGRDYHDLMLGRLRELEGWLAARGVSARAFVDSEPVLDRFWAWRSGLGWLGKNTMLINRKLGSFMFLGGLLVAAPLEADTPGIDHCGRCRKCIDACPTAALTEVRSLDSSKCIGFHTIENKGAVPPSIMAGSGRWIAGCDICQCVCPWNDPVVPATNFESSNPAFNAELTVLARWSETDFKRRIGRDIAMGRMKYSGFLRNIAIAVANSELTDQEKLSALTAIETSAEPLQGGVGKQGVMLALEWARRVQ